MMGNIVENILLAISLAWIGGYGVALLWFNRAPGRITRFEREIDGDNHAILRGIITFKDHNGVEREIRKWIALPAECGEWGFGRVTVLYHPKYTNLAMEWSYGAFLGLPSILIGAIGVAKLFGHSFR